MLHHKTAGTVVVPTSSTESVFARNVVRSLSDLTDVGSFHTTRAAAAVTVIASSSDTNQDSHDSSLESLPKSLTLAELRRNQDLACESITSLC